MKKYLIINHNPPIKQLSTEETLEFILSIASLDNEISVLLLQNAVFQLLPATQYNLIDRSLLDQTISAFNLFELKNIYIEDTMIKKLHKLDLIIDLHNNPNIKIFSLNKLNDLIKQHDITLFF